MHQVGYTNFQHSGQSAAEIDDSTHLPASFSRSDILTPVLRVDWTNCAKFAEHIGKVR